MEVAGSGVVRGGATGNRARHLGLAELEVESPQLINLVGLSLHMRNIYI
jgi:hypothetical protein